MRVLHAMDPAAVSNKKPKEKYKAFLKSNPGMHPKVLKALDSQLAAQRNKLQYLPALEPWVNQRMWEKWMDVDIDKKNDEGRITTTL